MAATPVTPLDPEIVGQLDLVQVPDLSLDVLPMVRDTPVVEPPPLSDAVERTDHVVDEETGVFVRVHRPVGLDGPLPCLYSIHGGGYVMGGASMDDAKFDDWCPELGIVGVSIDYRLAPETPYPGALDDCYAGLRWTFEHAEEIGVDPDRIGISGRSAGGGLCAALAVLARDRGEIPVQFQLLDCPMLDDRQMTVSSQADDLIVWTRASNTFAWKSYLGDLYGRDDVPALAAPARQQDLGGLPEAYVCVGGADGFRDEDITYAMRLSEAGVPTELHVYPGAPHLVALWTDSTIGRRYVADQLDWLRRQFARLAS